MQKKLIVSLVAAALLLAACAAGTDVPTVQGNPSLNDVLPPEVALNIQNQISQILGVPVESIQLESIEQTDWPNSCLGLPEAEEACTEVITPGWSLAFNIDGQEYRFRVDQTGTVIRREP